MATQVTIVLPTYNQAQYLPMALEGVFGQTYPHFELVAVNDGSTDDTAAVLTRYRQEHSFTIIEQENQGLPRALNAGFARARGEYLTWTSSDNIMLPDMLATLVEALEQDPAVGLIYADFFLMDDSGQRLGRFDTVEYDPYWLLYTNLVHCCFLYRRECMERTGGYDPEFVYNEDWEYWIRLSRHFRMKRVPAALYHYRLHGSSMTSELQRGSARHLAWVEFSAHMRKQMSARWYGLKLRRLWAHLSRQGHPAINERTAWLHLVARTKDR